MDTPTAEPLAPVERDEPTVLPMTDLTMDRARAKLSGLHFAKECLSDGERDILYIAEGLLRLIDEEDPHGFRR